MIPHHSPGQPLPLSAAELDRIQANLSKLTAQAIMDLPAHSATINALEFGLLLACQYPWLAAEVLEALVPITCPRKPHEPLQHWIRRAARYRNHLAINLADVIESGW